MLDLFFTPQDAIEDAERCHDFFLTLAENFQVACAQQTVVKRFYQIGHRILCLVFAGEALVNITTAALQQCAVQAERADLTIYCWDSVSTHSSMPPPPWEPSAQTFRGDIKGYNNSRYITAYVHYDVLYALDRDTQQGFFWTHDAKRLPFYFAAAPLRPLLHWFCRLQALHLFHAAGVAYQDRGVLIAGRGGSGKSTSAVLCMQAGLDYLGDDYVAVGLEPQPTIHNLFNTAKVVKAGLIDIPALAATHGYLAKTPDYEKATLFFDSLKKQVPLHAILVGKVMPAVVDTVIHKISALEAIKALVPTTMAQIPGIYEDVLTYVKQLTSLVPCYRIEFGSDLKEIPRVIMRFIKGESVQ